MEIQDRCLEYFRSVNPIAQKIAEDIDDIRDNNKTSWNSLDSKKKDKLIDDALIDYNLVRRYDCVFDPEYEDGAISNFSWFSRSQLNLFTHINVKPDRSKTPLKKTDVLSPQKKTKNCVTKVLDNTAKNIKSKCAKEEKPEKNCSKGVAKPKTPPPPPPAKLVPVEQKGLLDDSQLGDDIPKTGFDFLDNW